MDVAVYLLLDRSHDIVLERGFFKCLMMVLAILPGNILVAGTLCSLFVFASSSLHKGNHYGDPFSDPNTVKPISRSANFPVGSRPSSCTPGSRGPIAKSREFSRFNKGLRGVRWGEPGIQAQTGELPCRSENSYDPYELSLHFKEVDPHVLAPHEWHACFAVHMQHAEHITVLEGRGVVAAVRHKLRATAEHGKKHLHVSANMGLRLLISKGRSGAFGMLKICRSIEAVPMAPPP